MKTTVLAQKNEHCCILLHNLSKSKQIQSSSNISKHTHLRKGFGVPMSTILQGRKEFIREACAWISPCSDTQQEFRMVVWAPNQRILSPLLTVFYHSRDNDESFLILPITFNTNNVPIILCTKFQQPLSHWHRSWDYNDLFQPVPRFPDSPSSTQSYLSDSPSSSCRFSKGEGNSKVLFGVRGVPSMESLAGGASPGCFKPAQGINVKGEEPN